MFPSTVVWGRPARIWEWLGEDGGAMGAGTSERVDEEKPRRGRWTEAARKSQHERLVSINCYGQTWDDHTAKSKKQSKEELDFRICN